MNSELSVEQKSHLGRIAAKQFLLITNCWGTTDNQKSVLAGAATRTTISTWRKRVNKGYELQLGNDTYERLICIGEIHRSLLESTQEEAIAEKIRHPCEYFNTSLLNKMLRGWVLDLYQVKSFLNNYSVLDKYDSNKVKNKAGNHTNSPLLNNLLL